MKPMHGISAAGLRRSIGGALLMVSVAVLGCGSKQDFVEVEGIVVMEGKPLPNVLVRFYPEPSKELEDAPSSEAITDDGGRFRLYCPQRGRDGAVVATHRVLLIDLNVKDRQGTEPTPSEKPRFSLDYSRSDSTDLRQDVNATSKNVEIRVTRKPS